MTAGSFCSSYHLIVCRIRFSEPDVFTDTFIEQKIVLCNITVQYRFFEIPYYRRIFEAMYLSANSFNLRLS